MPTREALQNAMNEVVQATDQLRSASNRFRQLVAEASDGRDTDVMLVVKDSGQGPLTKETCERLIETLYPDSNF